MNKKGMETWVIVFWIIALVLLVIVLAWYFNLGQQLQGLFAKLTGRL